MSDRLQVDSSGVHIEGEGVALVSRVFDALRAPARGVGTILGMAGLDYLRHRRLDYAVEYLETRPSLAQAINEDLDLQAEVGNVMAIAARATEIHDERTGRPIRLPSLKMREALSNGMAVENDPTLQELWARLLAAAVSEDRAIDDSSMCEVLKRIHAEDARVFRSLYFLESETGWHLKNLPAYSNPALSYAYSSAEGPPEASIERLLLAGCIRKGARLEKAILPPIQPSSNAASMESVYRTFQEVLRLNKQMVIFPTELGVRLARALADDTPSTS